MEKKNPMLAGLLNMFVPGSVYWYVDQDLSRFIKTLLGGVVLLFAMVQLGNAIQGIRNYSLPQGVCMGILILLVLAPLFLVGQRTASQHNQRIESTALYTLHRHPAHGEGLVPNQAIPGKKDETSPNP